VKDDIRQSLAAAVGTLDHVAAVLSRCEHGASRGDIQTARTALKGVSADLLAIRARVAAPEATTGATRHEH
jgi:hypothetical protein